MHCPQHHHLGAAPPWLSYTTGIATCAAFIPPPPAPFDHRQRVSVTNPPTTGIDCPTVAANNFVGDIPVSMPSLPTAISDIPEGYILVGLKYTLR